MFAIAGRVKDLPSKALAVACGGVHTACITVDGLYVWGLNEEGNLISNKIFLFNYIYLI